VGVTRTESPDAVSAVSDATTAATVSIGRTAPGARRARVACPPSESANQPPTPAAADADERQQGRPAPPRRSRDRRRAPGGPGAATRRSSPLRRRAGAARPARPRARRTLEAVARLLGQAAEEDRLEGGREQGRTLARWRRLGLDVLPHHVVPVVAGERQRARRRLVQRDAQRVEVGPAVERQAARLLGREVAGRAEHHLPAGRRRQRVPGARDAEVGDERAAVGGEEHVVRLHVAVHDVALVCVAQSARDVLADADHVGLGRVPRSRSRPPSEVGR
jgi:hypothetical protein